MDDLDLFDPGTGSSDLGADNLSPSDLFSPSPGLLSLPDSPATASPISNMDDDFFSEANLDDIENATSTAGSGLLTSAANSLFGTLGTLGTGAFSTFVTNPVNNATAQANATLAAELGIAKSNNLFQYLIIGLVIYLAFQFFSSRE